MKIIVTGHADFVGRSLLPQEVRWRISPAARMLMLPNSFDVTYSNSAAEAELFELKFEHVIHLAALSNIPQSFQDFESIFDVNITEMVGLVQRYSGACTRSS